MHLRAGIQLWIPDNLSDALKISGMTHWGLYHGRNQHMAKLAKRVKANNELVDQDKIYTPEEAIELAKKTANTKFVGSIEVHVKMLIDAKKTDQAVRGTVSLPHGSGKTKKVAAFVTEAKEKEAKDAGAHLVGGEELIKQIKETEKTDFDVAVAEPALMPKLAQIAKILGTRGLMPNPKTGTVGPNVGAIIKEIAGGKVNFKNDDSGNIHQVIGKTNFDSKALLENLKALNQAILQSKPQTVKGQFIVSVSINSTMGPGIKIKI
jgi:large subunit ribosomal protein L1